MTLSTTSLMVVKKIGRIEESGRFYDQSYGGKAIGRTDSKDGTGYWLLKEKEETTGDRDK